MDIILYNKFNFFSIFKKKISNYIYHIFLFFLFEENIKIYIYSFSAILKFCHIYYLNFHLNTLIYIYILNIIDEF